MARHPSENETIPNPDFICTTERYDPDAKHAQVILVPYEGKTIAIPLAYVNGQHLLGDSNGDTIEATTYGTDDALDALLDLVHAGGWKTGWICEGQLGMFHDEQDQFMLWETNPDGYFDAGVIMAAAELTLNY